MNKNDMNGLKANLGLVFRGDFFEIRSFADDLDTLLSKYPEVRLVFRHFSGSKLWIKEGGDEP
jgi:hypothetical protein